MSKDSRLEIRIDEETSEILERLCEKYAISKAEVLRKLVKMANEYRLLEPNWMEYLLEDTIKQFEEKEKVRLRSETYLHDLRETSHEKDRQLQKSIILFREFMKSRTESERRDYFAREIHRERAMFGEEPEALPAKLGDGFEVYINAKRLVVKELKDGMPKLEFNQERLIRCERGFHTKATWCRDCENIATCPIIRDERLEAISRRI